MQASDKKGVQDKVLIELNLPDIRFPDGNKPLACRTFRLRVLDVKPGKAIGLHSHENRAGALSIVGGVGMTVYAYGREPVDVLFGESYKGENGIVHYARNKSDSEMLSVTTTDFLDDGSECHGKSYPNNTPIYDKLIAENDPFYAAAPKASEDDDVNNEYFRTQLHDLSVAEGKTPITGRFLRIRKITLSPSASIGATDHSNRPAYVLNIIGSVSVAHPDGGDTEMLKVREAANLMHAGIVEISNTGDEDATFFLFELVDPDEEKMVTI